MSGRRSGRYGWVCAGMCLLLFLVGCGGSSKPIAVTVTASATTVDGNDALTLTASVADDKNGAGVKWTVSGGGTLSNTTATGATYTAPAPTSSSATVTITATSVADSTKTGSATITVPAAPTVSTKSSDLTGTVGAAFSIQLQGSGGIPPYKNWAVSTTGSALPACITLSSSGVLSLTAGTAVTASCAGTYTNLIFTYTDSGAPNPLTATSPALTLTIAAAPVITISPTLPGGTVGAAYAGSVAATGGAGALTYSVASGALPPDLTLNTSTGAITGTPKAADAGTAKFTITAADAYGDSTTSAQLSITIAAAPAITFTPGGSGTVALTAGTYNVKYSTTVSASGGAGTLTLTQSGTLPAGLSFSAGVISGTPTAGGTSTFTVNASDAYGDSGSQSYSIKVSYPALTVSTTTLPTAYLGSAYPSTTLAATGGTGVAANLKWSLANSTALPAGLQLSQAGAITGTPTGTSGTVDFQVSVTDTVANISSAASPLSIAVKQGISIGTITLPTGYVGSAYPPQGSSATLSASGGAGAPYTWSMTAASGFQAPPGLGIGASTGAITGTPTAAGAYKVVITAKDSATPANSASVTLPITIGAGVNITVPPLASAYPGAAYTSAAFTASGGTGTGFQWSWAAAQGSTLPNGLSIGSSTGIITGSPVNAGTSSVKSDVVVTAKDSLGNTGTANATVTIEGTLTITTSSLATGTVESSYSQQLAAAGGSGNYTTWQITTGASSLAAVGLSLNTATGVISGSSLTAGTANFSVSVTDSQGHTSAAAAFTIDVNNQLKVNQTILTAGDQGLPYSQQLTASGGSGTGYTWTATSSNLASFGLSLTSNANGTATISGSPTQTGTASFTANVKDSANNTALQPLTIQINGTLALSPQSALPQGYVGVAYSGSVSGSGGSGNLTIAVTTPITPDGTMAASGSGSVVNITGTPNTAATVSFAVKLTDNVTGNSISQTYSIDVVTPTAPSIPASNPNSLGSATINESYSGNISANGGTGSYYWMVNGVKVPTSSGNLSLGSSGLAAQFTASNLGGTNTLTIDGNPTSTGTVNFSAEIFDNNTGQHSSTVNYSVQVNAAGQQISGQVALQNNCGGGGNQPPFTLTINTTPQQQVQTDSNGNYSFSVVPNGSYTITPSIPGADSSLFYPATLNVTVNNSPLNGENFGAVVGYSVAGKISYNDATGTQSGTLLSGQVYVLLNNNNCSGSTLGTSISNATLGSGGAYKIRGVPPGQYTVQAYMDTLGDAYPNVANPSGSASATVGSADLTNTNVTISNPTFTAPDSNPQLEAFPTAGGAAVFYNDPRTNGQEEATQYIVQWSTSATLSSGSGSSFSTVSGTHTFAAVGDGATVWVLDNTLLGANTFVSGTTYYFQARAVNPAGHPSGWQTYTDSHGNPQGVVAGGSLCSSGCTAVSGTVTVPATVTINPGAPLYVGIYQQAGNNGPSALYIAEIASPIVGANSYTLNVTPGSGYFLFGMLDQNKDGLFDAGDVTNVRSQNGNGMTVSGSAMSNVNTTLPGVNAIAQIGTKFEQSTFSGGSSTWYSLDIRVDGANKLPVAVTLTSGPNTISPMDIGPCTDCGNLRYEYTVSLPGGTPAVGDQYNFTVTYSDGTQETGSVVNGKVTGWNGGSTVVDASDAASNLTPSATSSTSTTPTFTWTDSTHSMLNTDYYQFGIYQSSGCMGNCNIWQVPSQDSNLQGFSSSTTSLTWGTDPNDSNNVPTVGSLTLGDTYGWYINVQDANGNTAQTSVWYQP